MLYVNFIYHEFIFFVKANAALTPEQRVRTLLLDMESASNAQISKTARSALEISPNGRVDVLVNNAGAWFCL